MIKKILTLVAVVAMAFSACAGSYTFSLSINDIPASWNNLTADATCYLISGNQVIAYVKAGEYDATDPKWNKFAHTMTRQLNVGEDGLERKTDAITINGKDYSVNKHIIFGGSVVDFYNNETKELSTFKDVTFNADFSLDNDDAIDKLLAKKYSEGQGKTTDLSMILWDEEAGYYQEFNTVGYNNESGHYANFQAAGNFIAVPEPTSGLLVLMGLAGLALRRRKAA